MITKIFLVVIVFGTFNISIADSKIRRFQEKIKTLCQDDVSLLLVKKSMIELIKGEECQGKFTNIVLNKCEFLDCRVITDIYKEVHQVRSGSVVGEE